VNFLGHTAVALDLGHRDAEFVLGAVLPDLASMAGVRVQRTDLARAVGDGVACHLRADAAFHAHAEFRAGSSALRHALMERGLGSGPARAVGHAGWELLLDGTLVGSAVEAAFRAAVAGRAATAAAVDDTARWTTFVDRMSGAGRLAYDDPAWVAERLHTMLERRPRLALARPQVGLVAEVLAAGQADVVAASAAVLRDTAQASRDPG